MKEVVERMRPKVVECTDDEFFRKLHMLSQSIEQNLINPTVLLIGVDDTGPLTILDGNHRMAAAMLRNPPQCWTASDLFADSRHR